jgi:uncharacterized membrane protein YraQ (UPF0718 family)
MTAPPVATTQPREARWAAILGAVAFVALAAAALTWAKWTPYAHKLAKIRDTRVWPGSDILAKAGAAHADPSIHGAWDFTVAYANAVWPAVIAGLLIAAAVESLLPRRWLLRVLGSRSVYGASIAGGLCSLPSLMCTCCTAPVAATLRRSGASTSAAVAYWLGNPVLNPAVLAFLLLVAPWQWAATRVIVGVLLVFGASAVIGRLAGRDAPDELIRRADPPPFRLVSAPARFGVALGRLAVTLLPEYLVVVFLVGLFRGWLFPLDGSAAHWGLLGAVVAVVLGTLVVIPTGGEIPIALGLAAGGVSAGTVGALLITLPAISVVSMAMVARAFSTRVTLLTAGAVMAAGALAAGVLVALGG